jgi:prevent-host-death family protein
MATLPHTLKAPSPRKSTLPSTTGRTLSVSQAKTHLLSLLNDLQTDPAPITITKRGRPIAQLIPASPTERPSGYGSMKGTVTIKGDIVSPDHTSWGIKP